MLNVVYKSILIAPIIAIFIGALATTIAQTAHADISPGAQAARVHLAMAVVADVPPAQAIRRSVAAVRARRGRVGTGLGSQETFLLADAEEGMKALAPSVHALRASLR